MTVTATPSHPSPGLLRRLPPLPGEVIAWPVHAASTTAQTSLDLDLAAPSVFDVDALAGAGPVAGARDRVIADLRARAARFTLAVIETVTGDRPVTQLERWMTPNAFDDLAEVTSTMNLSSDSAVRARTERPRLVSVRVSQPAPDAAEVCGHVQQGCRSRAVALRLERQPERWLCTAVQLG